MSDSIIILDSDSSFNDSIGVDQSIIDLTEDTLPIEPRPPKQVTQRVLVEQRRSQATTNTSTGTSDFHNESCFIVNDLDLDFKITSEGPHKPKLPPLKKLRKIEEQKKVESHPISCPICLSDVNEIASRKDKMMATPCGHLFCTVCLKQALKASARCPKCRAPTNFSRCHILHDL